MKDDKQHRAQPAGDPSPDRAEKSRDASKEGLLLRDWQILFGYASHFTDSIPSLEILARRLVQHGVVECAFLSDGEAWWPASSVGVSPYIGEPRPVEHGTVELRMSSDLRRAQIKFDKVPEGFPFEALGQSAALRYQELSVFGPRDTPPRYVRAYLGKCCFINDESKLQLYPHLKIFENGVVLVYFRAFSPETPLPLARFLQRYVNAPLTTFRKVLVPPGIAYWAPLAAPDEGIFKWNRRLMTARDHYHHRKVIAEATSVESDSSFSFPLVSLSAPREKAIVNASETALQEASEDIIRAAKHEVGLADNESEHPENYMRVLEGMRLPGEALEAVSERLEENLNQAVTSKAEAAGALVVKEAVRMLREQEETLAGVALTIMAIASLMAGKRGPPSLARLALLGPGGVNSVGNHWGGHHHVHLIRFRDQGVNASYNEEKHRVALASIIARVELTDDKIARSMLPKSSRLFDDVGVYIAINGSLWVQSRSSLQTNVEFADPNKDHLVNEQQAKAELLDYAYALHRRIADDASGEGADLEDLLEAQNDLAKFELSIHDSSHFGEIRGLISDGLEAYEVGKYRMRVAEFIRVRELISSQEITRRTGRYATVLSLIAGVLAVPSLGTAVIMPAWVLLDLPLPVRKEMRDLLYMGLAAAIVAMALVTGWLWATHHKRPKPVR